VLLLAALAAAVAGGDDASVPSGDAATHVCDSADRPAPRNPCITAVCGNELGVGMTCSAGTGECGVNGLSGAIACSLDVIPESDFNICTKGCTSDADCGSEAVCAEDPEGRGMGCIPAACAR